MTPNPLKSSMQEQIDALGENRLRESFAALFYDSLAGNLAAYQPYTRRPNLDGSVFLRRIAVSN
jgi:hypothetical protein